MKNSRDYRMIPFTFNRKMVKASATVARGHNTIHAVMEADISGIRRRMRDHKKETGESLSMTAFWFIPLGAATVLITVGGIGEKLVLVPGITTYALMPLCPYAPMPLCPYALMPSSPYALMPLCPYALMPLCPQALMQVFVIFIQNP